jgi:hypothetical protein
MRVATRKLEIDSRSFQVSAMIHPWTNLATVGPAAGNGRIFNFFSPILTFIDKQTRSSKSVHVDGRGTWLPMTRIRMCHFGGNI